MFSKSEVNLKISIIRNVDILMTHHAYFSVRMNKKQSIHYSRWLGCTLTLLTMCLLLIRGKQQGKKTYNLQSERMLPSWPELKCTLTFTLCSHAN